MIKRVPWNKGIPRSAETKKKISEAHKGKHYSLSTEFKKGNKHIVTNQMKKKISEKLNGHLVSQKTRERISQSLKGKTVWNKGKKIGPLSKEHKEKLSRALKGEKSSFWQGGISFELYGKEFNRELKEQIRDRDKYRCQECFRHQDELYDKNGKKYSLLVHHIDYDKKNNKPENLISLCRSCHAQTNFGREDWIKYYHSKIERW